ncbi:hypothetical protein J1N35_004135 [Gossypium stocksii]|uniref:Uncharacterized protein n=1 Tax=Gossypium stocksii TaxID=47602 RepID=A0A9D3WDH9_9ROSI|nr:hypothetical protein J1N35_004135 [Gossypium stocksii]
MAKSLIRLDDKHISIDQWQMTEDQILETYISNLLAPPLFLIEPYLINVRFLHMAHIDKGCKLDPTLVYVGGKVEI